MYATIHKQNLSLSKRRNIFYGFFFPPPLPLTPVALSNAIVSRWHDSHIIMRTGIPARHLTTRLLVQRTRRDLSHGRPEHNDARRCRYHKRPAHLTSARATQKTRAYITHVSRALGPARSVDVEDTSRRLFSHRLGTGTRSALIEFVGRRRERDARFSFFIRSDTNK